MSATNYIIVGFDKFGNRKIFGTPLMEYYDNESAKEIVNSAIMFRNAKPGIFTLQPIEVYEGIDGSIGFVEVGKPKYIEVL